MGLRIQIARPSEETRMHVFHHEAAAAPLTLALGCWLRGLARTELLGDIATGGPYTLLAPTDDAFRRLRWPFERLMVDERLVEPCVDLFEYSVIRGQCSADEPVRRMPTMHGDAIHIGAGCVFGTGSSATIVASMRVERLLVHVVDGCLLPSSVLAALRD